LFHRLADGAKQAVKPFKFFLTSFIHSYLAKRRGTDSLTLQQLLESYHNPLYRFLVPALRSSLNLGPSSYCPGFHFSANYPLSAVANCLPWHFSPAQQPC
jgi:hypothetical protein